MGEEDKPGLMKLAQKWTGKEKDRLLGIIDVIERNTRLDEKKYAQAVQVGRASIPVFLVSFCISCLGNQNLEKIIPPFSTPSKNNLYIRARNAHHIPPTVTMCVCDVSVVSLTTGAGGYSEGHRAVRDEEAGGGDGRRGRRGRGGRGGGYS